MKLTMCGATTPSKLVSNPPHLVTRVALLLFSSPFGRPLIGISLFALAHRYLQLALSFPHSVWRPWSWLHNHYPSTIYRHRFLHALSSPSYTSPLLSPTPFNMCICRTRLILSSAVSIRLPALTHLHTPPFFLIPLLPRL